MWPLVVFIFIFCLVGFQSDQTLIDLPDFTPSRWCSQAQILLNGKDIKER
jgi:hypothetical protein